MPEVDLNYFAILIAGISSIVVSVIYYAPPLLGKIWMKEMDIKQINTEAQTKGYLISLASGLLSSFVLAHFVDYAGVSTWQEAIELAIWIWAGFVVSTLSIKVAWGKDSEKLFLIAAGNHLISLTIMSLILALWV